MVKRVVCFLCSLIFIFLSLCLIATNLCLMNGENLETTECSSVGYTDFHIGSSRIKGLIHDFFKSPFRRTKVLNRDPEYVYLAGVPVGIAIETDGVVVIAKGTVETKDGEIETTNGSDIKVGDIITLLGTKSISSTNDIAEYLKSYNGNDSVRINLLRNGHIVETKINPAFDIVTNRYRLGLWVRDTATGVGTLTFIKENGEYSALGHPISDIDTASKIDVKQGNIYKCNVIGVKRGVVGNPGELRGLFLKNNSNIGTIVSNTKFGIRGKMNESYIEKMNLQKYEVGRKESVKVGKAKIVSTIDGVLPEEFDIEIVKTAQQNNPDNKSMIIHVTDKRLLEKTGGIVQGMSGSPIVQDGKIIGAVTHVFVNDPTRGYGLYMDWMLD